MEFRDYVDTLRRRWIGITVFLVVGLAISGALAFLAVPTYQAASRVFVATQSAGSAIEAFQGGSYTQQRMQSYVEVASGPIVLDEVIAELDLDTTAEELSSSISARVVPDTVLIEIVVTDESPEEAADLANAVARSLRDVVVDELEEAVGGEGSLVNLTLVKRASVPSEPSSPVIPLYLGIGAIFGLALGLAFAFIRQALDTRLHSERDVRAVTDEPIVGGFVFDPTAAQAPLIIHSGPQSSRAEAFRTLRTNLQFIDFESDHRAYVVTSSLPSEGKTTTAVNLAIALAESGKRTLLIDADLRRPRVADYMAIEGGAGLSDVLINSATLEDVVQPWGESGNLWVLPAGAHPPNPSELLGSRSMMALLDLIRANFDQVIIDAPPLLPVTDGAILSKITDGALLVCAVGLVRAPQLRQALEQLQNIHANVLGLVINMLPTRGPDSYGTYGYEYVDKA
ncbi:succinoglycan biosynthesis transport protein ExoP [Microbacteriaceae bacterium SG_E_30_P1]|uniref:non-specific protein-tyrosine kinase n=1 Tax=Antiquaquibacter oligotrophicus TaxID=2880260 RepID=A0ABT6KPJ7_9MICO|nr:polysaccharide biosynthesis tyrosine autokinase [Antiquaquibacter oligotrophicus]MDH6181690.1 succinoglycan biosynthesis transport protein ExoP [Antiquaquibacter oligotrophicus]UDF12626.1 polysaccharide biosynthesis tyrosine autokinase [Antiquaquibacter oligotrophicus]